MFEIFVDCSVSYNNKTEGVAMAKILFSTFAILLLFAGFANVGAERNKANEESKITRAPMERPPY